jgi:LPXTG-motif cell wall-anchored protein
MTRMKVLAGAGALAVALAVPLGGVAAAQDDTVTVAVTEDIDVSYVGGLSETRTVTPAEVRGETVTAPPVRAQQLPVTGGDVLGLVMIGGAAIGTGAILVRRSRRTA